MPYRLRSEELRLPVGDLAAHALQVSQRDIPERARRVSEPLSKRRDRLRAHADRVALQVQIREFGERQIRQRGGFAAELGSMTSRKCASAADFDANGDLRRRTPSAS